MGLPATKGSLEPIRCYGDRGPTKALRAKPAVVRVLKGTDKQELRRRQLAAAPAAAPEKTPLAQNPLRQQQWMHNSTRIAVIQLPAPTPCGPEAKSCTHPVTAMDMAPLVHYIAHAAADGAQLLLVPEYHLVNIHLDETGSGDYANAAVHAVSVAAKMGKIYVAVGSWVLWTDGTQRVAKQYTNSILLFNRQGRIQGMYNKTHAADGDGHPHNWPPSAGEVEYDMVLGSDYPVFDLDFARIGIQTCYDGYFPEPMRALSLQGAEIVLWPNSRGGSIRSDVVSVGAWQNLVHIVAANSANGGGSVVYDSTRDVVRHRTRGAVAGPCNITLGKACYIAGDLDLHSLRVARKYSRVLHQRRAELSLEVLGKDWATSEFYVDYPDARLKTDDGALTGCPTAAVGRQVKLASAASWAASLDGESGLDVAATLHREKLDGEALKLVTPEQLHQLGIPLGLALKIKKCFSSDSANDAPAASWHTMAVTGTTHLIIVTNTSYPANINVIVTDGGMIQLNAGATLTIHGSFDAPLQQVFNGSGRVLLNGDSSGRLYPQWWGAVGDGRADSGAAIQSAVWAAQFPSAGPDLDFGGATRSATVFLPPGFYSIAETIQLPNRASLMGAGSGATHLVANRATNPTALIAPPNHGSVRTDGWRLSGFSLQGTGKSVPDGHGGQKLLDGSTNGTGIYLIQTSRAIVHDIGIAGFKKGLALDGRWNNCTDDGHGHPIHGECDNAIPCMYNSFYDVQIGQCGVGVNVNYSIANRFTNFVVGAVDTGFFLNGTNQLDITSPTIEGFNIGIDAMYGDTTHVYNAYMGNDGQGIGIRIAANMSESAIISPRLDHIMTPLINDSPTTIVLYWDSPGDPPSQCNLPPQCTSKSGPLATTCPADFKYQYGTNTSGVYCCANHPDPNGASCPSTYCCLKPAAGSLGCQDVSRCLQSVAAGDLDSVFESRVAL